MTKSRMDGFHNVAELRDAARRRLPRGVFEFIDRGTEDEVAIANNRTAFERIKLHPRILVDISGRSLETSLFGAKLEMPIVIAPTGAAGLCWHDGEIAMARAAAAAGIPFTLANGSFAPMERVAREAGGRLWFQIYLAKDRQLTYGLLDRAQGAGVEALIVTVDTPVSPNREHNARNGFAIPFRPNATLLADVLCHPRWLTGVMFRYLLTSGIPRFENYPQGQQFNILAPSGAAARARSDSMTWEDIVRLRERWPRTLILKGVLRQEDAERAMKIGVDGVIVSNHGGRMLDSSPAPIDVLSEIVGAVGHRLTVMLDSGIQRGSDIVKALALGARAVLIGRATLYGVSVGGESGAGKALSLLRTELDRTMALVGCKSVAELAEQRVHVVQQRTANHSGCANEKIPAYVQWPAGTGLV
jgi:(S)-mandelate dehydrogenase